MQSNSPIETRSVFETSLQHDASFVTAVRSYGNLGPFRPTDKEMFKGVRVFDLVIRPEQLVCASGIKHGEDTHLYGNWGVIIGDGDILQAYPYDATSYVKDGKAHSPYDFHVEGLSIDEQIESALELLPTHNEVNIRLGKSGIAGLYYHVSPQNGCDDSHFPSPQVEELLAPLQLPSYWLDKGVYYERTTALPPETLGTPTPLPEVLSTPNNYSEESLSAIRSFLVDELTLPPRNPITAGLIRAQNARRYAMKDARPLDSFINEMEAHLTHDDEDRRLYGAVALHAALDFSAHKPAEAALASAQTIISTEAFHDLRARVLPNGNIRITDEDLKQYISSGSLPAYLGTI